MQAMCTIYFADPFWVGVFERIDEAGYSVARHVFGAEPSDAELYAFILENYARLQFSPPGPLPERTTTEPNFKRRQRLARRQVETDGISTWAQRALQAERERRAQEHKEESRVERDEQERQKFLQRQERKKQKHKGR